MQTNKQRDLVNRDDLILHIEQKSGMNIPEWLREAIMECPSAQPELIAQGAYVRGFEQGRTQGMLDAKLQPTCNQLATDTISRQAAIDVVRKNTFRLTFAEERGCEGHVAWSAEAVYSDVIEGALLELPSAQPDLDSAYTEGYTAAESKYRKILDDMPWIKESMRMSINALTAQQWIPCSERLPEDLEEVNVTWVNHKPEPYYDFVKGKPFTASAVYYKGKWFWYTSTCADLLAEYGKNPNHEIDDAIEITAWMPLPEPWKGEQDE